MFHTCMFQSPLRPYFTYFRNGLTSIGYCFAFNFPTLFSVFSFSFHPIRCRAHDFDSCSNTKNWLQQRRNKGLVRRSIGIWLFVEWTIHFVFETWSFVSYRWQFFPSRKSVQVKLETKIVLLIQFIVCHFIHSQHDSSPILPTCRYYSLRVGWYAPIAAEHQTFPKSKKKWKFIRFRSSYPYRIRLRIDVSCARNTQRYTRY